PSGESARSDLRRLVSNCPSLTQRQTWPTRLGGATRALRSVHRRSRTMAAATTEDSMIGSISQPPALINSHTDVPSKVVLSRSGGYRLALHQPNRILIF